MLCSINKFSQLILLEILGDQVGEFVCGYCLKELNIPWTCKSCEQKAKLSIILWVAVKWHHCKMDAVPFTLFSPRYQTSKSIYIPRGGTPNFKWRGWSNGGKNQTQYIMLCAVLYLVVLYLQNCAAWISGHYHKSSDCLEYPQKILT